MGQVAIITDIIRSDGLIEAAACLIALRVTRTELASAAGLSRDAVSKTARQTSPTTQARLRDMVEIINRVMPMGRQRRPGIRLVSRAAAAKLRRPDCGRSREGRPGRGCEGLSRPHRRRRLRVILTDPVYRAHHPPAGRSRPSPPARAPDSMRALQPQGRGRALHVSSIGDGMAGSPAGVSLQGPLSPC